MGFEVRTSVFEGPLDLLAHLIARHEVNLYEVSLCAIVDAYLVELDRMRVLDLEVATEFLLIAATLVELKSRRLLPEPMAGDIEDELALLEERDVLVARLLECMTFRQAGSAFARLADSASRCVARTSGPEGQFLNLVPDLLIGIGPLDLHAAILRLGTPKPVPRVDLAHVTVTRATVGEAIDGLLSLLPGLGRATFRQLAGEHGDRFDVIVAFLALLELFKQGLVGLEQLDTFGEMEVTWTGPDDPGVSAISDFDPYG